MKPADPLDLAPLTIIRTETALSRYPVHALARGVPVQIEITRKDARGATTFRWEVSYNSRYGQPGPLAYKLDTLIINRRIEEAIEETGRPVPKTLRLGSLRDLCRELGVSEGENTRTIKNALRQNATAFITAKITYRGIDGAEHSLESDFNRYTIVFTGEQFSDGRRADAVYLVLNDLYREVLGTALTRPLDYDYLRGLVPSAQRFYELISYQVYAALRHRRPRARYLYSDYCTYAPQTRYFDYDRVKKQMYKVHRPHLQSGYLRKAELAPTMDGEGRPDWEMFYTPGPRAEAEYRAFTRRGQLDLPLDVVTTDPLLPPPALRQGTPWPRPPLALPEPPEPRPVPAEDVTGPAADSGGDEGLVEELVVQGVGRTVARRLAREKPDACRHYVREYLPFWDAEAERGEFTYRGGKGAFLASAIRDGYGPPRSWEAVQRKEKSRRKQEAQPPRPNPLAAALEARRATIQAELRDWVARMENEAPEAFPGFVAFVEGERQTMQGRFRATAAKESYRRLYESEAKRLELFAAYFSESPCPLPGLAAWLKEHPLRELKELLGEARL